VQIFTVFGSYIDANAHAQPWTMLLTTITDRLQVDSFALNMVVLLAGVLVNSWIIYRVFSWLSRRGK